MWTPRLPWRKPSPSGRLKLMRRRWSTAASSLKGKTMVGRSINMTSSRRSSLWPSTKVVLPKMRWMTMIGHNSELFWAHSNGLPCRQHRTFSAQPAWSAVSKRPKKTSSSDRSQPAASVCKAELRCEAPVRALGNRVSGQPPMESVKIPPPKGVTWSSSSPRRSSQKRPPTIWSSGAGSSFQEWRDQVWALKPKPLDKRLILVEFICRYWICLFNPPDKLKDCLDQKPDLEPVMITDAKALYDSYNKEGLTGSSSVDKRTSLEIRVWKRTATSSWRCFEMDEQRKTVRWRAYKKLNQEPAGRSTSASSTETGVGPNLYQCKAQRCSWTWSKPKWTSAWNVWWWNVWDGRWRHGRRDLWAWTERHPCRDLCFCRGLRPKECQGDGICPGHVCNAALSVGHAWPGPWTWTGWNLEFCHFGDDGGSLPLHGRLVWLLPPATSPPTGNGYGLWSHRSPSKGWRWPERAHEETSVPSVRLSWPWWRNWTTIGVPAKVCKCDGNHDGLADLRHPISPEPGWHFEAWLQITRCRVPWAIQYWCKLPSMALFGTSTLSAQSSPWIEFTKWLSMSTANTVALAIERWWQIQRSQTVDDAERRAERGT